MSNTRQIGEFAFKAVTFTFRPGRAGGVIVEGNFEGTSTGFGLTLGTMTVVIAGNKNGSWEWCGANFPEGGCSLTGSGQGTFGDGGANCWRTRGLLTISDGRSCVIDGELDLVGRTWNGRMFERG